MNKKNTAKPRKIRKNGKLILLFGILSALLAGFVLYTGIDLFYTGNGRAVPLLVICVSVLFSLLSIMINKTSKEGRSWTGSLFITLCAQTSVEVILLPFLAGNIRTPQIICCVMTSAAAVLVFLSKNNIPDTRIPLFMAFIAAGAGVLMFNLAGWVIFSGGNFSRLWIGLFFLGFFLILAQTLAAKACPQEKQYKTYLRLAGFALTVQCAALLFGFLSGGSGGYHIFQICAAAALAAGTIFLSIKSRNPGGSSGKKK